MARAASFDAQDVTILGQTLHFVVPPPEGTVDVAIVYNNLTPGSALEAQQIEATVRNSPSVAGVTLNPFIVDVEKLNTRHFMVAITADGAGTPTLKDLLVNRHAICMTGHLDQVQSGTCQIYVTSSPSVDIRLNQSASDAADIHFATAFRIMVHTL